MAQRKQGIWILIFPDRETHGIFPKTRIHSSRMRVVRRSGCLSCHTGMPPCHAPPCIPLPRMPPPPAMPGVSAWRVSATPPPL